MANPLETTPEAAINSIETPLKPVAHAYSPMPTAQSARRRDLSLLAAGVVLSFFLASVLLSGWPAGLVPNITHPYIYGGDGLLQFWMSQRAIEGWIFQNARSGFPFGSSFLDFPGSDAGSLLILKLLGKSFGSYFAANNIYLLLGFSTAFASAFVVLRKISLSRGTAFSGALLFAFLPYHFSRLFMGHLFYTWYFVIPIYFYVGFKISEIDRHAVRHRNWAAIAVLLVAASCFGVYFAFFGLLVIFICGLFGFVRSKRYRPLLMSLFMCASITGGVLLNVAPSIANNLKNGKNPEVAQRIPVESEIFALKLVHLFLPYQQHRISAFRDFTQTYNKTFPLSNTVSSLGMVGIFGFLTLMLTLFRSAAGQECDRRERLLMLLTLLLLLTATVGGLNVLFAILITPMIRAWDRISIFIAFFSITAFFVALERRLREKGVSATIASLILLSLTTVSLLDQTARPSHNAAMSSEATFFRDRKFIAAIEDLLPRGAAIYQMPYMPFPESANISNLGGYDLLVGFLNSKELRWSSGGMQGRKADLFYREISKKPITEQITTARSMGFAGIYVDKRGYADGGRSVIDEISRLTGRGPALSRDDDQVAFFLLK